MISAPPKNKALPKNSVLTKPIDSTKTPPNSNPMMLHICFTNSIELLAFTSRLSLTVFLIVAWKLGR
ncbi:hypothetical protein JCM2421_00510 [Staphylococcus auricularis]|nr:hypothetical protein JCM2421_00510 [Staphylococcus auricularis]